jgi:hypothetical protein
MIEIATQTTWLIMLFFILLVLTSKGLLGVDVRA